MMKTPTVLTALLAGWLFLPCHEAGAVGTTHRVSVAPNGTQADGQSAGPVLSADGRFVAFSSEAANLVPGDTNHQFDVFVHDRQTTQTTRVSVATDGTQANERSYWPALSADGRFVAFHSFATNLVPGDTNQTVDVFVHDRQSGQTTCVSVAPNGTPADGFSYAPAISADGRFVAFTSAATTLVPGDTNQQFDVFVYDRQSGQTTRVSVAPNGTEADGSSYEPVLSADGRFVTFSSDATNLVPGDTNLQEDVFVHDRQTRQTTRVSVATNGTPADDSSFYPALSAYGRVVTFSSDATTLVPGDTNGRSDVFVRDRKTGQTIRVSVAPNGTPADGASFYPALSADGVFVAFDSLATNLVPEDTNGRRDVFFHDRQSGQTTRVSVATDGTPADGDSIFPALSADGRFVAFTSHATTLVPGDTNGVSDVFVHDRRLNPAASADLVLVAHTTTPAPVQRGQTLTYAFTLTNNGTARATGTTLLDVLSSHLLVTAVTPSQGSCHPAHVMICRLGTLLPGTQATVTVQATVLSTAPATLRNTASALANEHDPQPGNNRKVMETLVSP